MIFLFPFLAAKIQKWFGSIQSRENIARSKAILYPRFSQHTRAIRVQKIVYYYILLLVTGDNVRKV